MATVEKLIVQIFERKKWIVEQVKHQTLLYDQHLASKCLIDGIAPPPWLWSSSFQPQTSDPSELKKEELISGLLLPLSHPTAHYTSSRCSLYETPAVTADNGGSCMEVPVFREGFDARDGLSVLAQIPDVDAGCASSGAPDRDPSVTSPEEFRDSRISGNYNEVALSLARLQRSKSRQRALEIRNSARAIKSNRFDERDVGSFACRLDELELVKSADVDFGSHALEEASQYNEDIIGAHDSQIVLHYNHLDESEPANPVDGENDHCAVEEAKVCQNDENNFGAPNCKLSLQNNHDASELKKSINTGDECCWADEAKAGPHDENGFGAGASGITPRSDDVEESEFVKPADGFIEHRRTEEVKVGEHDKNNIAVQAGQSMIELEYVSIFEATKPVDVSREIYAGRGKRKESGGDIYSARVTRSRNSGQNPRTAKEPIDAGKSSGTIKTYESELMESFGKSAQQPDHAGELTDMVKPSILTNESFGARKMKVSDCGARGKESNVYGGRIMRSRSSMEHSNHMNEFYRLDGSSDDYKEDDIQKSIRKPCQYEMLPMAKPFNVVDGTCGRVTRSRSSFQSLNSVDGFPKLDSSSHIAKDDRNMLALSLSKPVQSFQALNCIGGGLDIQEVSSSQVNVLPYLDVSDIVDQENCDVILGGTDIDSDELVEVNLVSSGSNPHGSSIAVELDVLGSRPPSEAMSMKPKQLDFDDEEEYSLNGTSCPAMKRQKLSTSRDKILVALLHSADLPEKVASASHQEKKYDQSMPMSLLEEQHVFCNKDKVPRCSTEVHEEYVENASGLQTRGRCTSNDNNSFCPRSNEHQFPTNSIHAEHSWTQNKRRRLDGQLSLRPAASLSLRVDDVLQSNVSESLICEMNQNVECHQSEGAESSYQRQVEKDEHGLQEKDESLLASFTLMHEKLGQSLVSGSTKLPNGYSEDSLLKVTKGADPTGVLSDAIREPKSEDSQLLLHVEDKLDLENNENDIASKNSMEEREILLPGNGKSLSNAVDSSCRKSVDLIGTDHIMPEFEGFIVQTFDEESSIAGDGISIDKLDLPTTTLERVSILERLCKSACLHTSLSEFSAPCKLNRQTNLTYSIPNGLLEGMDLRSTFSIDGHTSKQVEASYSCMNKDANQTDHGASHSNYLPFSGAQSAWDIRRPYSSPVAKRWNGITPKSGSSEKRGSLNIELPCISEENENVNEVADPSEEAFLAEVANTSVRREPLADITENLNAPAAVSEAEIFSDRCRLDSGHAFSFTGTFNKAKQKLGNHDSSKRMYGNNAKENRNIVIGTNGLRRATESLNKGFSKPKLSGQTSLGKGGLSFSKKDSKRNNIVSNITSFIPLVQQKQPAGIIAGKRNVKVKALEAAEGAKRLAEKKENERRMKKEAVKLERAKVEQENLRQLDLQKKMKEEERKKKEDDMVARKRQREEDKMKEKERKRRRAEEAQRQQRERAENLRAKKEEKQKKFEDKDERASYKKKSDDDSRKLEKREVHAHDNFENVSHAEPRNARTTTSNARKASIVLEECESTSGHGYDVKVLNDIGNIAENDKSITRLSYEESYDISPYKGSDDEDEEDEDLPNGKFIPSWASKHSVALAVSSQQRVDPAEIFPMESFCNIAEVLLPRKCQLR
ncbi:intracellular protein transport protein USO1 [Tripterygium wilfordii]|uniref:Intracellular protein transport protein USO1 n=1 Tax=Tripterygium wilfordii TaxID=458696 RepID=A0A7J7C3N1_TRIWF|nr:uncharacterized protein LOC119988997 [Tripterygium wilfordii]KAF5728467.1 intracellular protein transport protein USO1 [Tripterygium wilfordii]